MLRAISSHKDKNPAAVGCGVLRDKSLTMTYFHRRSSTIIGAKAFHVPVRDGKEWDHLAMVVKRSLLILSLMQRGTRVFGLQRAPTSNLVRGTTKFGVAIVEVAFTSHHR